MKYINIAVISTLLFLSACKKSIHNSSTNNCYLVIQHYNSPVWQPGGTLLGFNHTPISRIMLDTLSRQYFYSGNYDSTGFYLMNKYKTGLRRVTRFELGTPVWSPDGRWIAFRLGNNIYKMPFSEGTFDTTKMVQLTTGGSNAHPAWTANSDTIYYNYGEYHPAEPYRSDIWKMAADGTGKTRVSDSTVTGDRTEPFVGSDNRIYYSMWVPYPSGARFDIYSMNKDGSGLQKLTSNTELITRLAPKYWKGKLFYQGKDGLYMLQTTSGSQPIKVINDQVSSYDISTSGEVVYSNFNVYERATDIERGTLWLVNAEGGNKQQLTFNKL